MSRNTKIILGVLGGLIILCCLAGAAFFFIVPRAAQRFAETSFTEDSAEAADVAQSILDYELPDQYSAEMAMDFAGMKMVTITPSGGFNGMVFMLMQFPTALQSNQADMQQQMEEVFAQQTGQSGWELSYTGTDEVVLNGETVTLTIMEGTGEKGETMRQVMGAFPGKNGAQAMVMVTGPVAQWDADAYEQFFNSTQEGR